MDETPPELAIEEIAVLETHLDNATGELLGGLMDRLLEAGALDVAYVPMQMKKNRPAILLRVIVWPSDRERFARFLLRETPTLGVRFQVMQRYVAGRRSVSLPTPFGAVQVKLKLLGEEVVAATPEFNDCQRIAREQHLSLLEVMHQVQRLADDAFLMQ